MVEGYTKYFFTEREYVTDWQKDWMTDCSD
jgi:hypothetical protein